MTRSRTQKPAENCAGTEALEAFSRKSLDAITESLNNGSVWKLTLMSRSKHTDPRAIRAARRLIRPDEKRGAGDLSHRRRLGRDLKALGSVVREKRQSSRTLGLPRIVIRSARRGYFHPLTKGDIRAVFDAIGPVAGYGLRSVELAPSSTRRARRLHAFGSYQAGRIILYEQPLPPWRLIAPLPKTLRQLEAAGAVVSRLREARAALVDWPGDTLRHFMLTDVLLHEIGHHVLQQHKGKRWPRIARSRDHESFARRFARNQRRALRERSRSRT